MFALWSWPPSLAQEDREFAQEQFAKLSERIASCPRLLSLGFGV